jgi:hypothetical protein
MADGMQQPDGVGKRHDAKTHAHNEATPRLEPQRAEEKQWQLSRRE